VQPIPTLAGWVDVRRFFVYAYGQADMAENIHERHCKWWEHKLTLLNWGPSEARVPCLLCARFSGYLR